MYKLGISYKYHSSYAFSYIDFNSYEDMFSFYVNHVELFESTNDAKNLVFSSLKPTQQHPYGDMFEGTEDNSIVIQKELYEKNKQGSLDKDSSLLKKLEGKYRTWKRQTTIDEILQDLDSQ